MTLADYLERVDRGETITVTQMYREGAEEEIVELLEYGSVNGADIEVSRSDANKEMYDQDWKDILDEGSDMAAEALSSIPKLENQYEKGVEQADRKMEELDNKYAGSSHRNLVQKKARRKDTQMKASEAALGGGTLGFIAGNQIGSQVLMGVSAILAGGGLVSTPKFKGMKDREIEEAADGLEKAYGGHQVTIN